MAPSGNLSDTVSGHCTHQYDTVLYFYDYVLTLWDEVRCIWKSRAFFGSSIFLINRYAMLFSHASAFVQFISFENWTADVVAYPSKDDKVSVESSSLYCDINQILCDIADV